MTTNRVFITGMGALTSTGHQVESVWSALLQGESGLGPVTEQDLSGWPCQLGGELKDFQAAKMLPDRKLIKVISHQDVMGINVAVQAVEHSAMIAYRDGLSAVEAFNDLSGVYVGSPGNKYFQQYDFLPLAAQAGSDMKAFAGNLFNEVHPMWLLRILPNNVLAYTGITYGFKGPNHNVTNHAVGGSQALLEAYQAIRNGQAERAVVVGYDKGIEPQALFYYDKLGVLSPRGLSPFDANHDGTVLADGAAALVLESEASVRARGATCLAEILGGKAATEASGLFSVEAEGEGLAQLIQQSLDDSELDSASVDCVVAHGNGNPKSDVSEAKAINTCFGEGTVPVTAFKWSMGHTLCASGILDSLLAVCALNNKTLPGIAPFTRPASGCEGLDLSSQARPLSSGASAVVINRGFSSMNSVLVLKACD